MNYLWFLSLNLNIYFSKKWKTTFETTLRVKLAWFVENRIFMIVRGCKLQFSLKIYLCDWNFILYIWYRKYNFFNWLRMMSVLSILTCMKQGMLVSGFIFFGWRGIQITIPKQDWVQLILSQLSIMIYK